MKKFKIDLQLFDDGGAGAGAGSGSDSGNADGASGGSGASAGEDLSSVIYGVAAKEAKAKESIADSQTESESTTSTEDKAKSFEALIKKGGEYHDEYTKRTQSVIDKRFKAAKETENALKSHEPIINALASRYGVDASDTEGILKALENDDEWLEKEAFDQGLSKAQLIEKKNLLRENERLKHAEAEAKQRAHADQIYAGWLKDAEAVATKYGIENFDFASEITEHPEFAQLLSNPAIDFETAYFAIHRDDILTSAMAKTAQNVEQGVANRIASRHARPIESGVSSTNTTNMKPDVNALTNADIDEVIRRVRAGEKISFG